MLKVTEEMLYTMVRGVYHEYAADGVHVQLEVGEPLDKYAHTIASSKIGIPLLKLNKNFMRLRGAAQPWTKAGWVDLDAVCGGDTELMSFLTKYAPKVDIDSPLTDPVVRWLAELLKPRSIEWTGGDPIDDVIAATLTGTASSARITTQHAALSLRELRRHTNKKPVIMPTLDSRSDGDNVDILHNGKTEGGE